VQDVVAACEVPYGEALGELDGGVGLARGNVAAADGAEVDADAAARRSVRVGLGQRVY